MKNVVVMMKHERTDEECGSDDEAKAWEARRLHLFNYLLYVCA